MKEALVSICIPVYNGAAFIHEAIESALAQTHPNVRVVVRDNASTDATSDVVEKYVRQHPERIRFVRSATNEGMTANWNAVLQLAEGEFAMLLSADDYLMPDLVARALAAMQESDVAATTNFRIERDGHLSAPVVDLPSGSYANFSRLVILKNPFSINFTLFRRTFLEALSEGGLIFPADVLACDYDLWIRTALSGREVRYVESALGVYRHHPQNLSKQVRRMRRDTTAVIVRHKARLAGRCYFAYKFTVARFLARVCGDAMIGRGFDQQHARQLTRLLLGG